jgi:hypothetical protein
MPMEPEHVFECLVAQCRDGKKSVTEAVNSYTQYCGYPVRQHMLDELNTAVQEFNSRPQPKVGRITSFFNSFGNDGR